MRYINSSDFNERKNNLGKYFRNREKWKENEDGSLSYFKGKRNLKELRFLLELVFGEELEIIKEEEFIDFEKKVIGGSVYCRLYVDADFNGFRQGTKGDDVFLKFTLITTAYFYDQSDSLERIMSR